MTGQPLRDQETITAVATPSGVGGISVIRLSGPRALEITRAVFRLPEPVESHRVYYGSLRDPATGRELDEVLVTWFEKGRSFTGETTAEISCHGNPQICAEILRALIASGAVPADRGEFTYRAFMNGRLDLAQAESVLSLIESRGAEARRQSLRQLKGSLSQDLHRLENELLWCGAQIEAGIDFSAEGLDVVEMERLKERLSGASKHLLELAASYQTGRLLRDGVFVTLVGRPNVGKSSLLNLLSGQDRAIVTDVPGTTRDLIEAEAGHLGHRFVFVDTAGLRESDDRVESLGIERSRRSLKEADVVLFVLDARAGVVAEDRVILAELNPAQTIILVNKSDGVDAQTAGNVFKDLHAPVGMDYFLVSALEGRSREVILDALTRRLSASGLETTAPLMHARHFELVERARAAIDRALVVLAQETGAEFAALDIKTAVLALHEILGKRFDDQIMDRVFKEFCIGK